MGWEIVANGMNSAPINYNSAATYVLKDVVATVNDDGVSSTCTIGEVDMVGPSQVESLFEISQFISRTNSQFIEIAKKPIDKTEAKFDWLTIKTRRKVLDFRE